MGRKRRPDPGATEQVQGDASTRKAGEEQRQVPENDGLVNQKTREAAAESDDLEEAVQRGRTV